MSRPTQAMPTALQARLSGKARIGRPSRNAAAVMAQTAFTGVPVRPFTAAQTWCKGRPPSREKAHSAL